jgi:thiamine transporter
MKDSRVRLLTEIALSIALAIVLDQLRIWRMPQGGTVSLGMLPIFVLALRRGAGPGVMAGVLFGFLSFVIDPVPPVHWIQYAVDYPIAFGLLGATGIGARAWRKAVDQGRTALAAWTVIPPFVALGAAGRYIAHWLSGVVFFASYAPPGQPVWLYSAVYNLYVPISAAACIAAAAVVVPALERVVPVPARQAP